MIPFKFSDQSFQNLSGVKPELIAVATLALARSAIDFRITEGLRDFKRQIALVKEGKSRTYDSRHLTGHAIDITALINGKPSWDWSLYEMIAVAFKSAAEDLGILINWGGDWKGFLDGPHFELDRKKYPASAPPISREATGTTKNDL